MKFFDWFGGLLNKFKLNVSDKDIDDFSNFLTDSGFYGELLKELKVCYSSSGDLNLVRSFLDNFVHKDFFKPKVCYFIMGGPGSGKTTYILSILEKYNNWVYMGSNINKNEIRSKLDSFCLEKQIPCIFTDTYNFSNSIKNLDSFDNLDFSILIDTTSKTTDIDDTVNYLKNKGFDIKFIHILDTTRVISNVKADGVFFSKIYYPKALGSFFSFCFENKINILNDNLNFKEIIEI